MDDNQSEIKEGRLMASSVLSSRGQVVVPNEIRQFLRAEKGDKLIFQVMDGESMMVRVEKKPSVDALFGTLKVPGQLRNLDMSDIVKRAKTNKASSKAERLQD